MPKLTEMETGPETPGGVNCMMLAGPSLRCELQRQHMMDQVVHLQNKENHPPFSYLLMDQEPGLRVNTVFGNLPLGSCLGYQLQDYGRPNTTFLTNNTSAISMSISNVWNLLIFQVFFRLAEPF